MLRQFRRSFKAGGFAKDACEKSSVIMDGRDIGTYVLPDADLKVYLTATSAERARKKMP